MVFHVVLAAEAAVEASTGGNCYEGLGGNCADWASDNCPKICKTICELEN
jgi:hypothetical protein